MTRYIDADELNEWMKNWLKMDHYYHPYARNNIPINELEDIVERMPTVDAVPVIRCKDCKHSEPWYADKRRCFLWSEDGIDVFNDGFCNYAERREE